jgi:hypothetical protein
VFDRKRISKAGGWRPTKWRKDLRTVIGTEIEKARHKNLDECIVCDKKLILSISSFISPKPILSQNDQKTCDIPSSSRMDQETIARQEEQDHSHQSRCQYSGDQLVETRFACEGTGTKQDWCDQERSRTCHRSMKSKGNAETINQFAARED